MTITPEQIAAGTVELTVVAKRCIYLNHYRIAGGKPYVSENLPQHTMTVTVQTILDAMPMLQLKDQPNDQ